MIRASKYALDRAPYEIGGLVRSARGRIGRVLAYSGDLRRLWIAESRRGQWMRARWRDAREWRAA